MGLKNPLRIGDRRPIADWAAQHLHLPPVLSRSGPPDLSTSRHLLAPLADIQDPAIREVNILANVRSGKTLIADMAIPWAIAHDNASVLWVFASNAQAKEHCELRLLPVLESCAPIRALLPENRHLRRTQEIIFRNGLPLFVKGAALSGLQARGFKYLVADESWQYKSRILAHAKARLGDFVKNSTSKCLCIAQGGEAPSDWAAQYASGTPHEWTVPCIACRKPIVPRWTAYRDDGTRWGMTWETEPDDAGRPRIARALETIRFVCPHCGAIHLDTPRQKALWNQAGQFQRGETRRADANSYHWNAIIDYPWTELVREWLEADLAAKQGNFDPRTVWIQKRLAEHRGEESIPDQDITLARTLIVLPEHRKDKAWPEEAGRIMTLDRQADCYWVQIQGWERQTGASRRLFWGQVRTPEDILALSREFAVVPRAIFVDAGHEAHDLEGVYDLCIRHGWIALKGDRQQHFWHAVRRPTGTLHVHKPYSRIFWEHPIRGKKAAPGKGAPLVLFASDRISDQLQFLIDRGLWIGPKNADPAEEREYTLQLASEVRRLTVDRITGGHRWRWTRTRRENHARDCAKMQIVGAMIHRYLIASKDDESPTEPNSGRA